MSDDEEGVSLSETAARDLVTLLLKRGYFHKDVVPELADKDRSSAVCSSEYSETDVTCELVVTQDGTLLTKERLRVLLIEELSQRGGRMSWEDAALVLAVDPKHVGHVAEAAGAIIRVNDVLITEEYFDRMVETTRLQLVKHNGYVSVSELASTVWKTPMDLTVSALKKRIERGVIDARLVTLFGATVLVTPAFEEEERKGVRGSFRAITLPTHVDAVCHDFQWDIAYVVPVLESLCTDGDVGGEVHRSGDSLTGAMYIPSIYLSLQRKSVDEFFVSNGFVTAKECLAMGVLESRMGFVKEGNPSAHVLPNSVISRDAIVVPIEQALIESMSNDSFVDLRLLLPDSLMQYEQDVKMIVEEMALPSVVDISSKTDGGRVVYTNGEALFVSQGMINHISNTLLPPIIESFAKTRAEQMFSWSASSEANDVEVDVVSSSKKKKGRKASKKAKAALSQSEERIHCGVVPLIKVAKAVASAYPDLADIQSTVAPLLEDDNSSKPAPIWEQSEDSEGNVGGGPLYEFCRMVVYNDVFEASCEVAVKAELERLESIKLSRSVRNRRDGAAKMRSIESAFEDSACFVAACYTIQEHAKFLQYVEALPDVDKDAMAALKENFLGGCCALFAGRMTHYCLFRNEIEDGCILVESQKEEATSTGDSWMDGDLPEYCQPVDIAARRYPSTTLKCPADFDSEGKKMPLPTLREVLPGSVGVQLARTWALCGGKCYEGGCRVNEDGTESIRPGGKVDAFLTHVEENCLTICGLPFKKLDKKSEKNYLFSRRKTLTEQLEATNKPQDVLELTIMLLFQQVKGLVVSGPLLSTTILELLQKEKKISTEVSQQLRQLAVAIHTNASPDGTLVTAVKACGLSRDISKHIVVSEAAADNDFTCPNDALCGMLEHLQ